MKPKVRIFWTLEAKNDLEEIILFISEFSRSNSKNLFKKIKNKCHSLTKFPYKNRGIPELKEVGILQYRELIVSPYRILYKLTENISDEIDVYIIAVVDGRRNFEDFLFNRLVRVKLG